MLRFAITTLAAASFVAAQETANDDDYHTYASFAFIRTGERTPLLSDGTPVLTALGAHQMVQLGQTLRTRYISGSGSSVNRIQQIAGLRRDTLNNDQVSVQTADEQHLVASAQAFMQGLYPPTTISSGNGTGGSTTNFLANGSVIDYPLGGYQYAGVQTAHQFNPESVCIIGTGSCLKAQTDSVAYYSSSEYKETRAANRAFYNTLDVDWFSGYLNQNKLDYINAMSISEFMQYQYAHSSFIYRDLANTSNYVGVYDKARSLADQQAWSLYGNSSSSSPNPYNHDVPGKTLAFNILSAFQQLIADRSGGGNTNDMSSPLTLVVGEQEPMMSLLSLTEADHTHSSFHSIPSFSSALVFELFSTGANATFPSSKDDLWVRFLYHNGTTSLDNTATQLVAYPLFGNGPSRYEMPYREFEDHFSKLGMSSVEARSFCGGVDGNGISLTSPTAINGGKKNAITPVIGGVIGAIVTLAIVLLLFGLAMLFGGVRLHRKPRAERRSALGGFKRSAKLASDPDLSLARNGAPPAGVSFGGDAKRGHERVGSWELRQKEMGKEVGRESLDGEGEGIDAVAMGRPVVVEERV